MQEEEGMGGSSSRLDSAGSAKSQESNLKSNWIFGKWLQCRASSARTAFLPGRETLSSLSVSTSLFGIIPPQMDAVGIRK